MDPAAVAAAAAAALVMAAAQFNFATSPGQHSADRMLNMGNADDKKLYFKATERLTTKEDLFDLEPEHLTGFLQVVRNRANLYGWNDDSDGGLGGIFTIPIDPADINTIYDNLLDSYGLISLERVRNFEASYIATETRPAQDTAMLYQCLIMSLTQDAHNAIMLWKEEFYVAGRPSGFLLLRVIIRESHLDSNATTSVIRLQLTQLDEYMPQVASNILKFNRHVQELMTALHARGATTQDLLTNLFKGYKAASDKKFRVYVERQESDYFDGLAITPQSLMNKMSTRYKQLVVQKMWDAPSEEDKKIMAMQAQINRYAPKKRNVAEKDESKKQSADKGRTPDPDWLANNVKPDPASTVNMHKGAPWYYCCQETGGKCGGQWRKHKPTDCKGISKREQERTANEGSSNKKLKIMKALQAVSESEQADGTDEEQPDEPMMF
jgi:hypothetical protein